MIQADRGMNLNRQHKDAIIGGILAVLSCIYLVMSFRIKLTNIDPVVGSRMFPQICGTVVLALSTWLIVSTLRKKQTEEVIPEKQTSYIKTIIVLGSYAAYIFLMDKLGFACSSMIYLFSQMLVMGKWPAKKKDIIVYAVIAVTASAVIYVLFRQVFMLMLPKARWF